MTDLAKLNAAVAQRTKRVGDCLLWTKSCIGGRDAHPQLKLDGQTLSVRREIALAAGLVQPGDGLVVRMTCRQGRCLERGHMVAVDRGELAAINSRYGVRDAAKVSAAAKRHTRASSSLSETDVRTIFASEERAVVLAQRYGKSRSLIRRIKQREVWADVSVTVVKTPPARHAVDAAPSIFGPIGHYLPADTAVSRAHGGAP